MGAFRIRREMILDIVGFAQESPDETVISTVNVRLDEMFRESLRQAASVVLIHGDDLEKILTHSPDWMAEARTYQTKKLEFTSEDLNIDRIVRELNLAPQMLAMKVAGLKRLTFCHSPMFHYERRAGRCELRIWLRAVCVPDGKGSVPEIEVKAE